jgi:hypothetical protein
LPPPILAVEPAATGSGPAEIAPRGLQEMATTCRNNVPQRAALTLLPAWCLVALWAAIGGTGSAGPAMAQSADAARSDTALKSLMPPPIVKAAEQYRPTAVPDSIILTLTAEPARSQAVTWRTDTSVAQGVAELAHDDGTPGFVADPRRLLAEAQAVASDLGSAHYHTVIFQDLQTATQYAYRVGDGGGNWSEWNHFVTASEEPSAFSFIYFGDAQNNIKSMWSRVIREAFIEAPRSRFLLHAGDLVNRSTKDEEWGEWHYAGGWINGRMPSLATPGNHEYTNGQLSPHWRPQFAFPLNGPEGQETLAETVYYVDYQGARIVSLNSNRQQQEQAAWLDQLLSHSPQKWTIVTMHHPIYSAKPGRDNAELRRTLQPVFDKHRVDLVLQGHDHAYARSQLVTEADNVPDGADPHQEPSGTVYVVSVSGPKMYDVGWRPILRRAAQGLQLFQIIHIDGDQLRYEARTANGELYDGFQLTKRPGKPNELVDQIPDVPQRVGQ